VESKNLSVKVGESEVETEEERIEHESIRESDSNILDVSSDYPRGLLINIRIFMLCACAKKEEKVEIVRKKGKWNVCN